MMFYIQLLKPSEKAFSCNDKIMRAATSISMNPWSYLDDKSAHVPSYLCTVGENYLHIVSPNRLKGGMYSEKE